MMTARRNGAVAHSVRILMGSKECVKCHLVDTTLKLCSTADFKKLSECLDQVIPSVQNASEYLDQVSRSPSCKKKKKKAKNAGGRGEKGGPRG